MLKNLVRFATLLEMIKNHINMSADNASTGKYWLYFLVSTAIMLAMVLFVPEWFWVALPFSLTAFVKALDWM